MEITEIRVRKVTRNEKIKAVVSIILDGIFAVHDIKIIDGSKGIFVAMPSRPAYDPVNDDLKHRDIAHPLNSDVREYLNHIILEKYYEMLEEENKNA